MWERGAPLNLQVNFIWKMFENCFVFLNNFRNFFKVLFLKMFWNVSTWNFLIYIFLKFFKSLNSESFSNLLVRKPFVRNVWVEELQFPKLLVSEISNFFKLKNFPNFFLNFQISESENFFKFSDLGNFSNLEEWIIFQIYRYD